MHWIIQDNLYREEGVTALVETLDKFEIPYDIVKVVPFSREMIPDVNPTGLVMVCGSIALSKIAISRGWLPGSFWNENHDYQIWKQHYGDHLLNADSKVSRFADVEKIWNSFFIRPCHDTKSFSGMVATWEAFKEWQYRVIELKDTYTTLDADTLVSYGPEKDIWAEYRFFVIDGKIVDASLYKRGSRVVYDAAVDADTRTFAQQMIDIWCPARGFVIDVALTDDGYKVVEINGLNSSGFYAIDVQKLVEAIEGMHYD